MKLLKNEIEILKDFFSSKLVNRAFVVGSYSRGEADQESDIDILVELDYSKHIGWGFVGMKLELENVLHRKVDLISDKSVSKHILPFINKDKQLIMRGNVGDKQRLIHIKEAIEEIESYVENIDIDEFKNN